MVRQAVLILTIAVTPAISSCGRSATTPTASAGFTPSSSLRPLSEYQVEWLDLRAPVEMEAGKEYQLPVTVKNVSSASWPFKGTDTKDSNRVSISYHWLLSGENKPIAADEMRTLFPHDIAPGESVSANVRVKAPSARGSYELELSLVHELVAWFENKGAKTAKAPVKVR